MFNFLLKILHLLLKIVNLLSLDDEGHMNNVSLKPTKFTVLTGTLTGTNSSTTINGDGTAFTSELKQGDNIRFDSNDYPVSIY